MTQKEKEKRKVKQNANICTQVTGEIVTPVSEIVLFWSVFQEKKNPVFSKQK